MIGFNKALNFALVFAMLLSGIMLLIFFGPIKIIGDFLAGFAISIIVYFIFDKMKIDPRLKILVTITIWLHFIGLIYAYNRLEYYDKILHLINGMFATAIIYDYCSKNPNSKYKIIFLAALGIFVTWEFYEYLEDILFNLHAQGVFDASGNMLLSPLNDTMQDLLISGSGSLVYLLIKEIKR